MKLSEPGRLGRDLFGCYLLAWTLFALPLLAYMALSPAGVWHGLKELIGSAASGDEYALFALLATPPLLYFPFWIARMRRRPSDEPES